jgi:hypothetical protein
MHQQTLVCFPWAKFDAPSVAGLTFMPYDAEDSTISADIHRVMSGYQSYPAESLRDDLRGLGCTLEQIEERLATPGTLLHSATLVAVDGEVGGRLGDDDIQRVFDVREALSFAALAQRSYFGIAEHYWNDTTLQCYAQAYVPGSQEASVHIRRRGLPELCALGKLRVLRPPHVHSPAHVRIDGKLFEALVAARGGDHWQRLRDGMFLFNRANTDAPDIAPDTELSLTVSATQGLLDLREKFGKVDLAKAVAKLFHRAANETAPEGSRARGPANSKGPAPTSLFEAWFRDLYENRSKIDHGTRGGAPQSGWTVSEHLILAAYIVPRLTMIKLDELGTYTLSPQNKDELADFSELLRVETGLFKDQGRAWAKAFHARALRESIKAASRLSVSEPSLTHTQDS